MSHRQKGKKKMFSWIDFIIIVASFTSGYFLPKILNFFNSKKRDKFSSYRNRGE